MDWKVFIVTCGAVLVAELADKTQLVGVSMAARSGKPLTVWFGSVVAYCIITALSVYVGARLGAYCKPDIIRAVGGALFILIGVGLLLGKI